MTARVLLSASIGRDDPHLAQSGDETLASPQLYLIVEVGAEAQAALAAALAAAPVSSVLLKPAAGDKLDAQTVKPLVEAIQKKGVAALIADDFDLTRIVRADGVHLSWAKEQTERYVAAREVLGTRFIVGADAGRSRDGAMSLGEDGADYVAFGIPPHVEDRDTAFARQRELLSWWSEIFEVPCVGFDAATPADAADLAASHADFISVTIEASLNAEQVNERVLAFQAALKGAVTA